LMEGKRRRSYVPLSNTPPDLQVRRVLFSENSDISSNMDSPSFTRSLCQATVANGSLVHLALVNLDSLTVVKETRCSKEIQRFLQTVLVRYSRRYSLHQRIDTSDWNCAVDPGVQEQGARRALPAPGSKASCLHCSKGDCKKTAGTCLCHSVRPGCRRKCHRPCCPSWTCCLR
jgi:hypothetical protein